IFNQYFRPLRLSFPVSQCPSVSVPQCPSVSVSQCLSVPVPQFPSVSVPQCLSASVSQRLSVPVFQFPIVSVPQFPSVSVPQCPSVSVSQRLSFPVSQCPRFQFPSFDCKTSANTWTSAGVIRPPGVGSDPRGVRPRSVGSSASLPASAVRCVSVCAPTPACVCVFGSSSTPREFTGHAV
uniref:Uncharacterized protein n=1 Tax=Scleropages formosus TaxID=113540 RepID=A0A8C9VAP8_SCLFO